MVSKPLRIGKNVRQLGSPLGYLSPSSTGACQAGELFLEVMMGYRAAMAVVLHDGNRVVQKKACEDHVDTLVGEFGVLPFISIDNKTLLNLLDGLGIPHGSYTRKKFSPKEDREVTYRTNFDYEDLDLWVRNYSFLADPPERLEVDETGTGLIRMKLTYVSTHSENPEAATWHEYISHFGSYSVLWEEEE